MYPELQKALVFVLILAFALFAFPIVLCGWRMIRRIVINKKIQKRRKRYEKKGQTVENEFDEKLRFVSLKPGIRSLILIFFSIFFFRYAVGCYNIYVERCEDRAQALEENASYIPDAILTTGDYFEEIPNSFVHTLQTFSMDEDYTDYTANGKKMAKAVSDLTIGNIEVLAFSYVLIVSLLNMLAPVAGGAIILDMLMTFIPRLKLAVLVKHRIFRRKYYFSELNDRSLALAKSLYYQYGSKAALIFTDAYINKGDEKSSERKNEAESVGAICIEADILSIYDSGPMAKKLRKTLRKISHRIIEGGWGILYGILSEPWQKIFKTPLSKTVGFGKRVYLLIDDDEINNLTTLTAFVNEKYENALAGADIWVFSKDDAYLYVEEQVSGTLKKIFPDRKKTNHLTEIRSNPDLPIIMPINSYRNIVSHLLVDVPLYEPLVRKPMDGDGKRDLIVTVIGTGEIGMEAILSTYWCGQMENCRLHINVISKEFIGDGCEEAFFDKLDAISPEIGMSAVPHSEILRVYPKDVREDDYSPVYATFTYFGTDIKTASLDELFALKLNRENVRHGDSAPKLDGSLTLASTDYFIVALGSDEDDLLVADSLRRYIGNCHLESSVQENDPKTVIAYAIYDTDLCDSLNLQHRYDYSMPEGADIYMYAFGGLRTLYSEKNISMTDLNPLASKADAGYFSRQNYENRIKDSEKRMKDHYTYWSNIARGMHIRYKLFSFGLIDRSIFDYDDWSEDLRESMLREAQARYRELASVCEGEPGCEKKHEMAWLEHRRWNAYMRTKGFRSTALNAKYFYKKITVSDTAGQMETHYHGHDKKKGHKYPELRLHPCLVECDRLGIKGGVFDANGEPDSHFEFCRAPNDREDFDFLDILSYENKRIWDESVTADGSDKPDASYYDFKRYDYPDKSEKGLQ